MVYSKEVNEHYENPKNVGSFPKGEENVGTGLVGAPACGDVMKLQIKVNPETEEIEEVKFKTFGCMSAIAASSLATEKMKGKTLTEARKITNADLAEELSLPPVKKHCSVLAEGAIRAAIADFEERKTSKRKITDDDLAESAIKGDMPDFKKRKTSNNNSELDINEE